MIILNCSGLSLFYGTIRILENLNLSVNAGSKVGIIGGNGAGKTTLLKIINGQIQPTSGSVYIKPGISIGFLSQMIDHIIEDKSMMEVALSPFKRFIELEAQNQKLLTQIEAGDHDEIERYSQLSEMFVREGGLEFRAKTVSFLKKLGFNESNFDLPCSMLSGGQKTRLMLAILLLRDPDIIMLDEPTNHLDISAVEWLEGIITSSKKTFIIVSHDRYFLDKVIDTTCEIEHGSAVSYSGNYSAFKEKKEKLRQDYEKHYRLQQREIKRLEDFIENQRKWNRERNIIAAESRMKAIERMDKLEKPPELKRKITVKFASPDIQSKNVLRIENLSKAYPGKELFSSISLELFKSDRLFIIGKNGCGKSTLLKILMGQLDADSGNYSFGYSQKIGFYDQETQELDDDNTIVEEIWTDRDKFSQTEIRSQLARFGFYGEDIYKQISVLSGGERARLAIAKLILQGASVLILDEPTNHLDIDSKEVLEHALSQYEGAIISVSHDRYFIRSLADRVLEIDINTLPDGYCFFKGSYEEYQSYRQRINLENNEQKTISDSITKNDYIAEKERRSNAKKNERQKERLENEIAKLEEQLEEITQKEHEFCADFMMLTKLHEEQAILKEKVEECFQKLIELENS